MVWVIVLIVLPVVAVGVVGSLIWIDYRAWKREERMAEIRREMES